MTHSTHGVPPRSGGVSSPRSAPPWAGRYVTLDGMRGIAALAVALFHFNISQAPHGYVAVDFFFVLSGFVLTRTYWPRWQAGLTFTTFMKQRVLRLYPLFLVGIVVTTLSAISNHFTGRGIPYSYEMMAKALPFNVFMLPSPVTHTLYPLNVPAWSLFFEVLANLALVLVLFRLPKLGLLAITLMAAWWFGQAVLENEGGNLGAVWKQVGISGVRTAMSFTAGVLLARFEVPQFRPAGWVGLACLVAITVMLMSDPESIPVAHYDLLCSMVIAPLLVWIGARCEPPQWLAPTAWFLGEVSYAVYAVHWGLMVPLRYFKDGLDYNPIIMGVVYLACCIGLAWLCVRYVDVPMRLRMHSWMRAKSDLVMSMKKRPLAN